MAPAELLWAWAVAAPLVLPRGGGSAPFQLRRPAVDRLDPLAARTVEWLRTRAGGSSERELIELLQVAWFNGVPGEDDRALEDVLSDAVHGTLEFRGATATARAWNDGVGVDPMGVAPDDARGAAKRVARWRWMSLALPTDLWIALLAARHGVLEPDPRVDLGSLHLQRTLDAPCAETHLHVGAALSFEQLWPSALWSVARADVKMTTDPRSPLTGLGPDAESQRARLVTAGLARMLFGNALLHAGQGPWTDREPESGATAGIPQWVKETVAGWGRWLDRAVSPRARAASPPVGPAGRPQHLTRAGREILAALHALACGGAMPVSASVLASYYRRLAFADGDGRFEVTHLAEYDPLNAVWKESDILPNAELAWTSRWLARRETEPWLRRLFWNYVATRVTVFRAVTAEAGTAGLGWFRSFAARVRLFREPVEGLLAYHAVRTHGRGLRLGAVELRTQVPATRREVLGAIRVVGREALAAALAPVAGRPAVEAGVIFEFKRGSEPHVAPSSERGTPRAQTGYGWLRHGQWFQGQDDRARALLWCLRTYPEMLALMRGVDVASDELALPTWTLVPLVHEVRAGVDRIVQTCPARSRFPLVRPIQVTIHVGEDYRTLTEGLRRIDELLVSGVVCRGDRLGHAVALADGAHRGHRRRTTLWQPREDRLDDLLWELDLYAFGRLRADAGRVEHVRTEIRSLARALHGTDCGIDDLRASRRDRHRPATLERLGYPRRNDGRLRAYAGSSIGEGTSQVDGSTRCREVPREPGRSVSEGTGHVDGSGARRLLVQYLSDRDLWRRGQEPVPVCAADDDEARLAAIQNDLRRRLAALEVTVESNPSSNLLIGGMESFREHPMFSLQPLPGRSVEQPVMVSINTDDPIHFATSLQDEFTYAFYALIDAGISAQEALGWLATVRDNGWRSRFTLAATAVPAVLAQLDLAIAAPGQRAAKWRAYRARGRLATNPWTNPP